MKIQTKTLLLLLALISIFLGGLWAFKSAEDRRYKQIAQARAIERNAMFDDFIQVRGDNLSALVEDSTVWDEFVNAFRTNDRAWAEKHFTDETLATYQANAIWAYKPDRTLFFSRNNRYAKDLNQLPASPEVFTRLFEKQRTCHFYLQIPQGLIEIRGATVHPSNDRFRETTPQGYFFAAHIWINEDIRRMSLFTGYAIKIVPADTLVRQSAEEDGRITFSRTLPGWDGKPIAQITVENDSPIIRELRQASQNLFIYLLIFGAAVSCIVATCLIRWVRRPLRIISRNLETENPSGLEPLSRQRNEFGKLAELILRFRHTELRLQKAEEELRHSQKLDAVGRLAGGVAHDFNNLLTAIIGYSELLEHQPPGDRHSVQYARLIHKAGDQAAVLTGQLLAFSRKQILQPRVLDFNALVMEMEKLLQRIIGEHISISIRANASDGRVLADPHQLEQVIINLGVNARDSMQQGGSLLIETSNVTFTHDNLPTLGRVVAPGEYVRLGVTDTGSGIDQETLSRIFEPFFTTKSPGRGTGLGLATVYGIVKQSHGVILVETELGKGSSFIVLLPRANAPIEPEETKLPPILKTDSPKTILVVEDEEMVRQLVCTVLEEAGYLTLSAETPSKALELVRRRQEAIDLLVTDVVMPGMHGPALAEILRPLVPGMRVLYISGYSENDFSDQGVIDPNLDLLKKPFTQEALIRKIREVLDQQSTAQPNAKE